MNRSETFYSKLGFVSNDNTNGIKNKKILEKLKVKDSYLLYYLKKYNRTENIDKILELVEKNLDEEFIKFFYKLSNKKNFDKNAKILDFIIPKLFVKLKLVSQFNQQYYYDFM